MQEFNQSDSTYTLLMTLTELVTVSNPVYAFEFTHVTTKTVVAFTKTEADDESQFQDRYNAFTIVTSLFTQPGEWHYVVTEQQTGNVLEKGKLIIDRDFNFKMYNGSTSYKTFQG